jgi:hypothetical protein
MWHEVAAFAEVDGEGLQLRKDAGGLDEREEMGEGDGGVFAKAERLELGEVADESNVVGVTMQPAKSRWVRFGRSSFTSNFGPLSSILRRDDGSSSSVQPRPVATMSLDTVRGRRWRLSKRRTSGMAAWRSSVSRLFNAASTAPIWWPIWSNLPISSVRRLDQEPGGR